METTIFAEFDNNLSIDKKTFTKMYFIYNAINNGWCVNKKGDKYTFTRPHDRRKEVFSEAYLSNFIKHNLSLDKLNGEN
jgi:hypothetical protein